MLSDLQQPLTSIIKEAGTILAQGFGVRQLSRSKEGIHNLVTEFDTRVEQFLFDRLVNLVPGSTFLGEEGGLRGTESDFTWVVDPLDGTVNFAHAIPIFCVSIAAVVDGSIALGAIYQPLLDEMFFGMKGAGAWLNSQRIQVSDTKRVADSMLVTGFPYNVAENPDRCIDQFSNVLRNGLPIRRLGSAALDLAYTAAGRFDGFWEVQLQPWDMAAGVLLITEAGGMVTHYNNREFVLGANSVVATNGLIHQELVRLLQQ